MEPSIKIFGAEFVNVCVTINLDIMFGLYYINTIEHIKEALSFDRHGQLLVKHVEEDVCHALVRGRDRKVVDLTHKDDTFVVEEARVKARYMDCRSKPEFTQDCVGVFLSEAGRLGVTLHC